MKDDLRKHETILSLIDKLKSRMGDDAFDVVDHWDADLFAVGIAKPDDHDVLAYVCTYGRAVDNYFVSLELPPELDSDLPYRNAGDFEVQTFDELIEIILDHFLNA